MFSSNTENGITATYQDADNTIDLVGSATNSMLSGSIANSKLANSTITFGAGTGAENIALGGSLTIAGTTNEIEASINSGTITIGLPNDVVIAGNLTVNGTTVTNSATNTTIEDQLIELGTGNSGSPSGDSGIIIERGSSANAFMGWDESADSFKLGTTTATGASSGDLTITAADLVVAELSASNIDASGTVTGTFSGNLTGTIQTADQTNITSVGTLSSLAVSGHQHLQQQQVILQLVQVQKHLEIHLYILVRQVVQMEQ